ncbi:thioredoxin-like domain-containing protein [Thalassoglobus polymorphus]|uniref:Thiol-disulfide oxidoreductase ResA n=1 Tax=Thalassoglobus polymorphus TaxID=2527994 RepID=A0A517QS87_9PLAN|nr:thioredoxin-like domain-containing protein [Thalassoglobus polymorphus]QDT34471.1 Thiol-disulfide oxidoreductase ResA [Thalassoglobus polymorphus]
MSLRLFSLALLFAVTVNFSTASAQDAPAKEASDKEAVKESEEKKDPFAVPEGTDERILDLFLRRLSRMAPEERTPEGILQHFTKLDKAINEVASREVSEDIYLNAIQMRLQVLQILAQFGDNTAIVKQTKLLDQMKRDERPAVKELVAQLELEQRINGLAAATPEEKQALIDEVGKKLAETKIDSPNFGDQLQAAMQVARSLEGNGDEKNAIVAYKKYAEILSKKDHPQIGEVVKRMESTVRRLNLLGNSIEVAGPTVGGGEFKIEDFQGKVVLVDFWATWCGPCIAELPNLKGLYEDYHDKGFEVIGISLDEDEEALMAFTKEKDLPWKSIFFPEPEEQGWDNPIARHYGISGIPTAILVNQDGKVVSLQARGENLKVELVKLLGPVEEKESEKE